MGLAHVPCMDPIQSTSLIATCIPLHFPWQLQCLKTTQTSNPFVLIDEIDKLGRGYQVGHGSCKRLRDMYQTNVSVVFFLPGRSAPPPCWSCLTPNSTR